MKPKLFLVVLGGKAKSCNIEVHDVRWAIGESIEDTIPYLKSAWFGRQLGLHIDSYLEVKHVDGYDINLKKKIKQSRLDEQKSHSNRSSREILWFINLGGYDPSQMAEVHHYSLVIAETNDKAITKAKSRYMLGDKKKHVDNIFKIINSQKIDDCLPIHMIGNWEVIPIRNNQSNSQALKPDWYGYWRIDNIYKEVLFKGDQKQLEFH